MKTVIGIIGPIASGKDTVAEYISKKLELPVFQTSSVLREIARERKIPEARKELILLSRKLAEERGKDYIVKALLEKADGNCIITGMREVGQIEYLRKNARFVLISVSADVKVRYERLKSRKQIDEGRTFEEFLANEKEEDTKDNVQRLSDCMKMADYKIENNEDLRALFKNVDEVLVKMNY